MACAATKCAQAAAAAATHDHHHGPSPARPSRAGGGSNQAALRAAGIQAKLQVGGTHDPAEQEADRVADSFAFGSAVPKAPCSACAAAAGTVQRKALPGAAALPAVDRLPLGDGAPLGAALREPLEQHMGADLSAVRVHTDDRAAKASERIGARAFAHGSDIAFGAGQYAPHSTEGRRLIAHEVTHTVQQGRGGERPRVRGENGKQFTPDEMQLLKNWQEKNALADFTQQLGQDPRVHNNKPSQFGFGTQNWGDSQLRWENGRWVDPKDTYSDVCPSCHKRPWEVREERQKREADLARKKLEDAWPGMHAAQHGKALDAQGKSLKEDIATSHLVSTQARLALFDHAMKQTAGFGDLELLGLPTASLTPELKTAWLMAAQAAVLVDNFIDAKPGDIEPATMEPARKSWIAYFNAMSTMLGEMDRADAKRKLRWQPRPGTEEKNESCPRGCHTPAPQPASDFLTGYGSLSDKFPRSQFTMPDDVRTMPTATATLVGPLVARANKAIIATQAASDVTTWKAARTDYRWTISQLDRVLKQRGNQGWEGKDLVEQLDFTQQLLERQQDLHEKHSEALKIQAVFYPKHDFEDIVDETGKRTKGARGMPWHFYLVRTPINDARTVPVGYTWELHDITAPLRPGGRTVKQSVQLNAIGALAFERNLGLKSVEEFDPPPALFEGLNHQDFFPEGMLYWRYPVSGKPGSLATTAPRTLGDWLKLIGMAVAIVGGVLLPMLGAPAAIAFAAMAGGTALSIAGSVHRMNEMEQHGILTESAKNRFYWDIALDVANMMTLGLGRVATVARAANMARTARVAQASYFYVRRAEIAMDVVNVGIITDDLLTQYKTIQGSKMSPAEKSRAMQELFAMGMLSGALSFVSIKAGVKDWNAKPQLKLDVDPTNPSRIVANVDEAAEVAAEAAHHDAARKGSKAKQVTTLAHNKHTYRLWDDGRITRCSDPPCLLLSQSLVERIQDTSEHMLAKSRHHPAVQELAGRAGTLADEGAAVANLPASKRKAAADGVLARVKSLEDELAALRRKINDENVAHELGGRAAAKDRYDDGALDYDTTKYRWVYSKETGELKFQRKSMYVPRAEWKVDANGKNGKFEYGSMVPPVDAARAQKVRETSLSKDFPIAATVTDVKDLQRLRPASPYAGRRPKDWVLVKIDDNNLHQFATEAVPHGAIFEFPNGQRVWRTPDNEIKTDAPLGVPIGRQGWEGGKLPQLRTDKHGVSNEGVPVLDSTGVDHQRAHPRGQGTGFELYNHIPLAPTYVNQQLQARGIELYLSQFHKARPDLDLRLSTVHKNIPDTTRQEFIDYHVSVMGADGMRRELFGVRIRTDYSNAAKPARLEVLNMPRTAADMDLLTNTVDMGQALSDMESKIRDARKRKAGK